MLGTYRTHCVSRKRIKNGCFTELKSDEWYDMHCQGGTTMSGLVSDVDIRVAWPENWGGAKLLVEATRHEFLTLRLEKKFLAFQLTPGHLTCIEVVGVAGVVGVVGVEVEEHLQDIVLEVVSQFACTEALQDQLCKNSFQLFQGYWWTAPWRSLQWLFLGLMSISLWNQSISSPWACGFAVSTM